jgi:hypothetical protein
VKSALPLLAKQGRIIAMKGEVDTQELDAVRADVLEGQYSLEIQTYELPSFDLRRSLVVLTHLP